MITASTIQSLANKNHTTELNISREYIQHLFLSYFYRQPKTHSVFFKGGTALRIIYNSPRFSEDLDFNTVEHNIDKIEDCALDALKEIEREGIITEVAESKETSGGYFAIFNFKQNNKSIALQVEISFRQRRSKAELVTIVSDFLPPYTLVQLSQNQLVSEKIAALLSRQKPRDFYDLYFILRANLLSAAEKQVLPKVLQLLKKTGNYFEKELKLFLPKSHWPLIKDFKTTLEREIHRNSS